MAEPLDDSILATIKKPLGLPEGYDPFDAELLIHINSFIANLNQFGVGPRDGLVIDGETKWSALLEERKDLENVKSWMFMKVKMVFDSGTMSQQLIPAYERMIAEQEWRIIHTADPFIPRQLPLDDLEEV